MTERQGAILFRELVQKVNGKQAAIILILIVAIYFQVNLANAVIPSMQINPNVVALIIVLIVCVNSALAWYAIRTLAQSSRRIAATQTVLPTPQPATTEESKLTVAEEPDIWNLFILNALNEKKQAKLSNIVGQGGMNASTIERRVNEMLDKGWIMKLDRATGTYYSLTTLGKALFKRYGGDVAKIMRDSKKILEPK